MKIYVSIKKYSLSFIILLYLFSSPLSANDLDIFEDQSSSSEQTDTSIFEDKPDEKSARPSLDGVVETWLNQEKVQLTKKQIQKQKEMESYCRNKPEKPFGLTLTARCRDGYSRNRSEGWSFCCSENRSDRSCRNEQNEIDEIAAKQEEQETLALEQKIKIWQERCDNFKKNGFKGDLAFQNQMKQLDAEIEAERTATANAFAERDAKWRAVEKSADEAADKTAKDKQQAIEAEKTAKIQAAQQARELNEKNQLEARRKRCAEEYYKQKVRVCGCDYTLVPEALKQTSCMR